MIKAVIFDCFGVLVQDGWIPYKQELFAYNAELFEKATGFNVLMDKGLMSFDDFIAEIAKLGGVSEAAVRARVESNAPNLELFTFIADFKKQYKLGFLSNVGQNWLDTLFVPEQVALFDEIVLSCDVGMAKPQPEIYHLIADRLGCKLEECLLVDDQPVYCSGAEAVGMQAILFTDNNSLLTQLEDLGVTR